MTAFRFRRCTAWTVSLALVVSLSGCGTLFYPERKGQLSGRIDPAVAIVDGLGLLLFIVPGVIAYAIDFSNNTIYLPGSHEAGIEPISFEGELTEAQLASLIETHTGRAIGWQNEVVRVGSEESLEKALADMTEWNRAIVDS